MKKRILTGILFASAAWSQIVTRPESDTQRKYEVQCSGTATGEAHSLTVYLPPTVMGLRMRFSTVAVKFPSASDVTFEWGGAAPSGGSNATVKKQNTAVSASFTAVCDATSSSPSVTRTWAMPVSAPYQSAFDASAEEFLPGALTGRTLRVVSASSITGAYLFVAQVREGL